MNKATRFDVTVPLLWEEDDALERAAKLHKVPKAGAMRLGLYKLLEEIEPKTVKALLRIRLGLSAVITNALSIFTGTDREKAQAFDAQPEAVKEEISTALPTGGAKVVSDAVSEFDGGEFIPAKGAK